MFADSKSEITRFREILLFQFIFLDFKATLENFLRLGPSDSDMDCYFFIAADTKCANSVAGLAYEENEC